MKNVNKKREKIVKKNFKIIPYIIRKQKNNSVNGFFNKYFCGYCRYYLKLIREYLKKLSKCDVSVTENENKYTFLNKSCYTFLDIAS